MTGPEQHAATVRDALKTGWRGSVPALAALDELVALARQAGTWADFYEAALQQRDKEAVRAEAAEARADELQLALDLCIQQRESWREELTGRADELQRELRDAIDTPATALWEMKEALEQARREADQDYAAMQEWRKEAVQLRAALEKIVAAYSDDGEEFLVDTVYTLARAVLAGVQAEEQA